ncbi:NAD-dependent epimerase/dehydratase family protein [Brevundimonas sp.]|uniref:NAD-dependent epimerase/dehydratase family protein n=1 Tax=Brevundimonas sp. TaxID=1871086 RepID=UPI003D142452
MRRLDRGDLGSLASLRLNDIQAFSHPTAAVVQGSYAELAVRDRLVEDGIDVLFHLASLPGGAAERDPVLGRSVNLDGSIALLDAVARMDGPVVVYASSIAALGVHTEPVDDRTATRPVGAYGTHKAMVELYLADLTRRGLIDGRSVRPAGIVARPRDAYAGFGTAWMSDLFHAAVEGRDIAIPLRPGAHIWLQSIEAVADNLVHAARMPTRALSPHRAWTLPATVVQIDALVASLSRRTGHPLIVSYGEASSDHPPLDSSVARSLGFITDGDTDALVDAVVSRIERG